MDADGDGFFAGTGGADDCDDSDDTVYPGAPELCDGKDNDCDRTGGPGGGDGVDEDAVDATEFYGDNDADGYGNPGDVVLACSAPDGYVADKTDCDDEADTVHPGAVEVPYDGVDQDCSGADLTDVDEDGYEGLAAGGTDCDDDDDGVNPGVEEIPYDGVDQDCADGDLVDLDEDGYPAEGAGDPNAGPLDCDDNDAAISPAAVEVPYDGVDQDCTGGDLVDVDEDGFPSDVVQGGTDCDDEDPAINPDTIWYLDADGDGYGRSEAPEPDDVATACVAPAGYVSNSDDCDDADESINPDTIWHQDADGDTYGDPDVTSIGCEGPDGFVLQADDCDDSNPSINPGQDWYRDSDGDGYGDPLMTSEGCEDLDGYTENALDCDDEDASVNPDTPWYQDVDGDGFGDPAAVLTSCLPVSGYVSNPWDCDDGDVALHDETIWYEDGDGDGYGGQHQAGTGCTEPANATLLSSDCNDGDPAIYPGAPELCDGLDQNCDGLEDAGSCESMMFDGNDRVTVAAASSLNMSATISMEAWFMFTEDPYSWTRARAYILDRANGYRLWYSPAGDGYSVPDQFFCDLWDRQGVYTDHEAWETNVWYHIACTWDGHTASVYVDGMLEDTAVVDKSLHDTSSAVTIGYGWESGSGFTGQLDEVRIWSRALTEEEVRAGICDVAPSGDLAARWTFAPSSPQTVVDASGNGNEGTLGTNDSVEDSDPEWREEVPPCDEMEWCDGTQDTPGLDDDGDGLVDAEDDSVIDADYYYADVDGDGFGDPDTPRLECWLPDGYATNSLDCDDTSSDVYPGAVEIEDGLDNDCDGLVDERGSLLFDGSDDYVNVGDTAPVDITGPITMEAWINASDPNRDAPVMAKEYSSGRQQYWFGVFYNKFGLLLGDGVGWGLNARSSGAITPGEWTHIASVWDGSHWYNYQDGVLVDSGTYSGPVPTTEEPLTIGVNSTYDYTRYKGNLHDVRLWNLARTQEQIVAEQCAIQDSTGLVGRWLMDEGAGQLALDASGTGNHGRLGSSSGNDGRDPAWSDASPDAELEWFPDADGDGYGDSNAGVTACDQPDGHVVRGGDCDDTAPSINPGVFEVEDGVDNDCDGEIDETGSLHFDGSGDYVNIGDTDSVNLTGALTMEAWVYADDPNRDAPILAKENDGGNQQYWFGLYYNGFGLLLGNGSSWGLAARSSGSVVSGQWTHLASVWDGTNWYNYQDGVLVQSGTYTGTVPPTTQPLTIGVNSGYDSTRYQGYLSDVRLWKVARTQAQILDDQCEIGDTTGLVGRWMLDEGRGQVARDASGEGNDGRLGNSDATDDRDPAWDALSTDCSSTPE